MFASNDKSTISARMQDARRFVSYNEVDGFQRARIVSAMVEVSAELGYLGAAVAPVVARAGVSRRTFYELFEGREDCFLAAFEWGVAQMREVIVDAYDLRLSWRERIRNALAALLVLFDSEPELARMCVIEALGAGKLVLRRRALLMDELIVALGAGAPKPRGVTGPLLLTAEGVVGGAFSVVHGRLLERDLLGASARVEDREGQIESVANETANASGRLIELHGQLMGLIALPYLGPATAGAELVRSAPEMPVPRVARVRGDGRRLLERLDMRLTYRTVRCLMFIGEHPGASNRDVARGASVPDEGQASKLLARLVRLDLVINSRTSGPGSSNRWRLTAYGEQILRAVRVH